MAAFMPPYHRWGVCYMVPRIHCSSAKVHVFEPDWIKLLVETAQLFPDVAPHHQESARRLFNHCWLIEIAIQVPVPAVHRIRRPQPVDPE
jgi:hypothetical protein